MGIKNLSVLLKDKASSAFTKIDVDDFYGKRVAIDLNNLMCRYFSIYLKEEVYQTDFIRGKLNRKNVVNKWILSIVDFGLLMIQYGITPVFVLDGGTRKEKEDTKQKRILEKKKARNTGDEILRKIESVKSLFDVSDNDISELKKCMSKDISISREEVEQLKDVLDYFTFPVLNAEYDAEQMCCSLSIEGKVDAVYSTDMDCLAFGCCCLITDIDRTEGIKFNSISLSKILECLDLSFISFVDLCILCGCDFNQNIPKIGPKKSFELIKNHESIDFFPPSIDIQILKHKKCREIFEYSPTQVSDSKLLLRPREVRLRLNTHEDTLGSALKQREGRYTFLSKGFPEPQSKFYLQMPHIFEKSKIEVVFI